jgi:fermentation-respiration switch protein FrsA (DUF1100 family)
MADDHALRDLPASEPVDGPEREASERPAPLDPPAIPPAGTTTQGSGRLLRLSLPPLALLGGLGALELARRRFQRGRVFLPTRPAAERALFFEGGEIAAEDVYFRSEDGTRLHGWWIPHPSAVLTLVYCHGNRGNIADRSDIYRQLGRLKANIFAFDYRGYGRSEGEPSERGLFADVRSALDQMATRGIPYHRILLFGHSLGGAVAIDGALHRPVGGLMVQSSFTQLKDMARYRYPEWPMHWITSNEFRSIEKAPLLRMPKLFIHGTADAVVPFSLGQTLYQAAREPKIFLRVPNADHHDLHLKGGLRYFHQLVRFRRAIEARALDAEAEAEAGSGG